MTHGDHIVTIGFDFDLSLKSVDIALKEFDLSKLEDFSRDFLSVSFFLLNQ